ncbi:MAG: DUF962 domain-containing protein [Deltaproteobacteria bacterium]|nr:MAG: DUF962 domain-containing protein [Deltaproteobacteria bacterium]
MSQTSASARAPSALLAEARAYWDKYVWHHRHPWTRRLHRMGSWTCIAGFTATGLGYGWWWTPIAVAIGYGFAFTGHWVVERNRPLTFENPIRAGIANWVMFFYEMIFDVERDIARLEGDPPTTDDMGTQ